MLCIICSELRSGLGSHPCWSSEVVCSFQRAFVDIKSQALVIELPRNIVFSSVLSCEEVVEFLQVCLVQVFGSSVALVVHYQLRLSVVHVFVGEHV